MNHKIADLRDKSGSSKNADHVEIGKLIGVVIGAQTLLAAVLYYFGRTDFHAKMRQFGIGTGVVHLSTIEYLLNGAGVLTKPLLMILISVFSIIVLGVVVRAMRMQSSRFVLVAILMICFAVGLTCLAAGVLGLFDIVVYSTRYAVPPILLAAGALLIWSSIIMLTQLFEYQPNSSALGRASLPVLVFILLLSICWVAVVQTRVHAAEEAASFARECAWVKVLSKDPLELPGRIPLTAGSAFPYQYQGLRLLLHADDTYFLIPDRWEQGKSVTWLVRESTRIQISLKGFQ